MFTIGFHKFSRSSFVMKICYVCAGEVPHSADWHTATEQSGRANVYTGVRDATAF